jgi:hypothetical protein
MTHPSGPELPAALKDLDLDLLVGLTAQDGCAVVIEAGGEFRSYDDEHPLLTKDLRTRRVTARLVDSLVVEARGFA